MLLKCFILLHFWPLHMTWRMRMSTSGVARTFGAHGQRTLRGPFPYFITLFFGPSSSPTYTPAQTLHQWRNRWGAGGQSAPRDFWPGNFCWRIGKKEAMKRGENWEVKKENKRNCKKKRWKLEMEVENVIERGENLFFFFCFVLFFVLFCFFVFFLFCFFAFTLLKRTEIYFGSTKMGIFYREKHFTPRKKSGKMTAPQKNMPVTPLLCTRLSLLWQTWF